MVRVQFKCPLCDEILDPLKATVTFYDRSLKRLVLQQTCKCGKQNIHTLLIEPLGEPLWPGH